MATGSNSAGLLGSFTGGIGRRIVEVDGDVRRVRCAMPGFYMDDWADVTSVDADVLLLNRAPQPDEVGLPLDGLIQFTIADIANSGSFGAIKVWISTDNVRHLAYDSAAGGFQAPFNGSNSLRVDNASPESPADDEAWFVFDNTNDYISEEIVWIEIQATVSGQSYWWEYSMQAADETPPVVEALLWKDPRRVRIEFDDDMVASSVPGGTLFCQDVSGSLSWIAPNQVRVTATPSASWVGYFLGAFGSAHPHNNGAFKVTAVDVANKLLTVDTPYDFIDDGDADRDADGALVRRRTIYATVSSYRFVARLDAEEAVVCAFEPVVVSAEAPEADEVPIGVDTSRFVNLTLHDDISFGRQYYLEVVGVTDDSGNSSMDETVGRLATTSPWFGIDPNNHLRLDDPTFFPQELLVEDDMNEQELRKMLAVAQDGMNSLWYRQNQLQYLNDPEACPAHLLDFLLHKIGNPFNFTLTELEKRRLVDALMGIFQRKGTPDAIEDAIAFFTGINVLVRDFNTWDWWTLGYDKLGRTTALGPDSAWAKNAFEVISPIPLTAEQRIRMKIIAEFLKLAGFHLSRVTEPDDYTPSIFQWMLGFSGLGYGTKLKLAL